MPYWEIPKPEEKEATDEEIVKYLIRQTRKDIHDMQLAIINKRALLEQLEKEGIVAAGETLKESLKILLKPVKTNLFKVFK